MTSPQMTSTEFAAARQRLGWTPVQAAVEYNVTPSVIEGFERGSVKIPKAIARDIRFRSAMLEREEVLAASGIPECSVMVELDRAVGEKKGDDLMTALDALVAHGESCALCRQRSEYVDRHGPPLPEPPASMFVRIGGWAVALLDRLPLGIRPPQDKAGEGRRIGLAMGAVLSAFACAIVLLLTIARLTRSGVDSRWWRELAALPLIIAGYLVGFYLAGWVWDALRPIHHRFIGYVLRFGLAGAAIYGAIAPAMPFLEKEPVSLQGTLAVVGFASAIWALIGAGLWVKDRLQGKLPKR